MLFFQSPSSYFSPLRGRKHAFEENPKLPSPRLGPALATPRRKEAWLQQRQRAHERGVRSFLATPQGEENMSVIDEVCLRQLYQTANFNPFKRGEPACTTPPYKSGANRVGCLRYLRQLDRSRIHRFLRLLVP